MDSEFTFLYPVVTIPQQAFRDDGSVYVHGVDGFKEGHIVYQGRLMCGESIERLCNQFKTKRKTIRKTRIDGISICKKCQEKYKNNPSSAWHKWYAGLAKEAGKTPQVREI
jgi:hypothetical protein